MVGTLLYISPEQINGRDADARSDIYTLGIGLFEAVTGRLPFERKTDFSLMHAHMLETPPRPRQLQRNLPRELEGVILKAIEKDPARRYQNAVEFRAALLKQSQRHGLALPGMTQAGSDSKTGWLARLKAWRGRAFGHLGFDLMLLVVASALVLALGLYPSQSRQPDDVAPVTRLTTPKVRTFTATTKAQLESRRVENERAKQDKGTEQNRYDSLRKAWGG
jgi:serine/threonine-protein kinase